jgi:hypothetical protein
MVDSPAPAFTWGANGARMTPEDVAGQKKVAAALMQEGSDTSPFPTGTRGWGEVTQGLARVAKGVLGGLEDGEASKAAAANQADNTRMIAALLSAGGAKAAAPATAAPSATPSAADATAPRGIRNNNALNIEDGDFARSQPGYAGTDGRFAKFATPDQGTAAANNLLDTYQQKHGLNTVAGIVGRWAPATDGNDVSSYAADVSRRLGIDPNAPLTPQQRPALIAAMGQHENGQPIQASATAAPAAAAPAAPGVSPAVVQAATSPYADPTTKAIAGTLLAAQLGREKKDTFSPGTDADGNQYDVNNTTHERKMFKAADKDPASVQEYEYYKKQVPEGQTPMDYATFSTAKARAGAANVSTNVDMGTSQTYDKQLAEGLGKSHAALANGVEDAQTRARDIAGMQGAIDAIQKNGGTTGGMGAAQVLELKKTLNAGATSLGMGQPFDENSLSDAELMQKLNRQMAGAQAKNAVGARVTNFDMQNYLAANPGLSLSPTANQRLLGVQAQVEQRNIAVGNAIRDATAQSISSGKKIDPVTVQGIITDYDKAHHISDPISGQDLTQSYALPEFQTQGNNAALAVGHETNINGIKIRRVN